MSESSKQFISFADLAEHMKKMGNQPRVSKNPVKHKSDTNQTRSQVVQNA